MKLRHLLLLTAVLAAPIPAFAQPFRGIYIGGAAGANFLGQESIHSSPGLDLPSGRAQFSNGFVGLGSIGYGFGNGVRVELEGSWRNNALHALLRPGDPTEAGGRQVTAALMVNALFDIDIGSRWIFPYLGGGIGYAWTDWQRISASAPGSVFSVDDTAGALAYQAMAGLSFPVPHVPGLSFTAEYRFFAVPGALTMQSSLRSGGRLAEGDTDFSFNHNQSILLGVRYAFGITPPLLPAAVSPQAAPTPQEGRDFLVFFNWNEANLTERARQVIGQAAHVAASGGVTRINVHGYTDTSGHPEYNQRLSVRRAEAVAAQLISDGVPKAEIAIMGYGETHLLVPTGPGVREARNRRVEIILH
ncbi:MAG: OmpA family protein [Acetobacteraceae bacterium]